MVNGKRGITFSETVPISNKRTRFTMPTTVVHTSLQVQRQRRARYLPFFCAVLSILITSGRGDAASVSVAPSLTASQTQQFTAAVTGAANAGVTWSVSPAVGTISGTGVYTAPASIASAQNVTVKATSTADPTQSASSTLSLIPVAILLTPSTPSLTASQTQQFTTTVTGTVNTGVTWSLSPAVGTISVAGLYTAPATIAAAQTVTVKTTSVADPAKSASATVTLNPPVNVTVAPPSVTLTQSQAQTFSATVTNTGNTAVTWSLSPVVGSITAAGLYTAPASVTSSQTVTVKATSVADPTKSATATVTLTPRVAVSLTPSSLSLLPSQNQTFTATVSGTSNTAVTWSINPALGGLASSATTAVYVAPSTAPTTQSVTITATSMADPSKTATAVITLLQAVTVALSPLTVSLAPSGTQHFTPTVSGASNTAVTWSVNPSVGTISPAGLYTAPSSILTSQTITLTAQSVADSTKSASAAVTLSAPVSQDPSFIYYVDSANGSDSNPGTLAQPWKTIAKVNATPLLPGQSVAFQAGGVWREQLTVPSSGSAGHPITFTSYGSGALPLISAAVVVSGLWNAGSNIWEKTGVTTQPPLVIISSTLGTLKTSRASCTSPGNWYWVSGTLSVYATSDPSGLVEVGARTSAIDVNAQSYITIDGIHVTGATGGDVNPSYFGGGISVPLNSSHVIIQNVTSENNRNYDVLVVGSDHVLIQYNTFGSVVGNGTTYGDAICVWGYTSWDNVNGYVGVSPSTNVNIEHNVVSGTFGRQGIAPLNIDGGNVSDNTITYCGMGTAIDIEPDYLWTNNNLAVSRNHMTSGCSGVDRNISASPYSTAILTNVTISDNQP